ncbi:4-oxalomesaconate tautomerase [Klebsiella quasipneumoniae]|uniref:4-oxalomesaconate tautomerase n=1 Tax=Klebsiella quasipneumoniae TaxID=1463165 RepID=UPI001920022E|nr:4-oxalomesaconate tautomerase [Klebsiella quasipneumoniae]MCS6746684.1 4-oxalomesaconate tautomerase [Klebsiella quasipneumoniae]
MKKIPCALMRGGTSKGAFLLADDLPQDTQQRDEALLTIMGSGHELEIDGIGGGSPQTSKVAIVSQSASQQADVDYLFVQVIVNERRVDTTPNCGNMLCAVGGFAIEKGLVAATSPVTRVRIRNVNTNTFVDADIQTPNGQVVYEGNTHIDGVPGHAAPVGLTFLNAAGAKSGQLFPTGNRVDIFDTIRVTCIDMAMPMVIIPAQSLGKTGYESANELDQDKDFFERLESIRKQAGAAMGFGDVSNMVIPKPVLVAPPQQGGTLSVRYFMPHSCHKSLAITGAIGLASACIIADTVVNEMTRMAGDGLIKVEHPSGSIDVRLSNTDGQPENIRASVIRTARKILSGMVYLPD